MNTATSIWLRINLAAWCARISNFLMPFILLAPIGGAIGAWKGSVPWWWGLACCIGIFLLCWLFGVIAILLRQSAMNDLAPFQRYLLTVTGRYDEDFGEEPHETVDRHKDATPWANHVGEESCENEDLGNT